MVKMAQLRIVPAEFDRLAVAASEGDAAFIVLCDAETPVVPMESDDMARGIVCCDRCLDCCSASNRHVEQQVGSAALEPFCNEGIGIDSSHYQML